MAKATTIKDAIKRWEEKHEAIAIEAKDIQLQFQWPPIEKMDSTLSTLKECTKLSLSTNMIEKIVGVVGLKNLRILSLARNYIKSLAGIEVLGDSLEELWISYNLIDKLKGIEQMKKLKVLYIGNNLVKDWSEYMKLNSVSSLEDLLFFGNPLMESLDETVYKTEAIKRLPFLKKLDGETVVHDDD